MVIDNPDEEAAPTVTESSEPPWVKDDEESKESVDEAPEASSFSTEPA
jgi:hypothetical protein